MYTFECSEIGERYYKHYETEREAYDALVEFLDRSYADRYEFGGYGLDEFEIVRVG